MYCRKYNIALSNIERMGMEVGRHLGDDPTTSSHSLVVNKWSGRPPHDLIA